MALNAGEVEVVLKLKDEAKDKLNEAREALKEYGGVVGVALAALSVAVTAVAAGIIELAEKGSVVNEVAEGFDRLAGSEENAGRILAAMKDGVKGTVDNLTLMADANKLLQSGVRGNADDFGTLTRAALVLSNEGFGGTTEMMDMLSTALERGASRQGVLKAAVGDLDAAERAMQETLGQTEPLDKANKLIADRQGLMTYLKRIVSDAGEQELTLGKQLEQAEVAFKNWLIELEQAVAKSPELQHAFNDIKKALADAFGNDGKTLIDTIVAGVGRFSNAVDAAIPYVISFGKGVKEVWNFFADHAAVIEDAAKVVATFATAWAIWDIGGELVVGIISGFTAITVGIEGMTAAIVANPLGAVAVAALAAGTAISYYANAQADAKLKTETAGAVADAAALAAKHLADVHKEVKRAVEASGEALHKNGMSFQEWADFSAKSLKTVEDFWDEYNAIIQKDLAATTYAQAKFAIDDWVKHSKAALDADTKAQLEKFPGDTKRILAEAQKQYDGLEMVARAKQNQLEKDTARADETSKAYYDRQAEIAQKTYEEFSRLSNLHTENEIEAAKRAADALTAAADGWQPWNVAGISATDALKVSLADVSAAARGASDAVAQGATQAASAASSAIQKVTAATMSFSQAMDAVRQGMGSMSATIQASKTDAQWRKEAADAGGRVMADDYNNKYVYVPGQNLPGKALPGFASGGPTAEGPAYLHDGEYVVPKDGMLVGGGSKVFNLTFNIVDTEANIARRVSDQIMRTMMSAGQFAGS